MKISIKDQNYYNTINSCKDNGTTGVEYVRTLIDKSFENGIEACKQLYEEKLRWIPVEEKLPENRERVLVKVLRSDKSTIIVTGSVVLDSKLGVYWQSGHSTQLNVTHWLSLSFL